MILQIFILEKPHGDLILHRDYRTPQRSDKREMLAAILTTIANVANETIVGVKGIDSVRMKGCRWVYIVKKYFYFIIAVELNTPLRRAKNILRYIERIFQQEFPKAASKWPPSKRSLNSFIKLLDNYVWEWDVANLTTTDVKTMNIINIYENIFRRLLGAKLPPKHIKELTHQIFDYCTDKFGDGVVKIDPEGSPDLFGIMTLVPDYRSLKQKLAKLFDIIFEYLKGHMNERNFKNIITRELFPYIRQNYRDIDIYNVDEAIMPKILALF